MWDSETTSTAERPGMEKRKVSIDRVGVIGGGQMGAGIAEAAATARCDVVVHEISPEACESARSRIDKSLERAVDRGKLEGPDRDSSLARLTFATELGDQADRQLVIEVVTENQELKRNNLRLAR